MSEDDPDIGVAEDDGTGIAIVGMAGRFPGAPGGLSELWRNLRGGVESIPRFQDHELEDGRSATERAESTYVPARSVLEGVEMFDAAFFGMRPREAALADPQARVLMELCWEALEDAALDPARSPNVGVFAGSSMNTYFLRHVLASRAAAEAFADGYQVDDHPTLLGALPDSLATRIAYRLDLRGPALTLQTACSTSLVAVAQACQSLLLHGCDAALAGGVSITFPQRRGYRSQEGGIVSPDGRCRPFDADAAGTVFGHGAGVVLLRRLSDALADGDPVHAVIRGWGLNNDGGLKAGFAAPSAEGQAGAIAAAMALAGFHPASVGYVECHGTATPLGDPIELAGLTRAFREGGAGGVGFCRIGSIKGNLGHLDAAAGVAGLIKATMCVREGAIPPTLHFRRPNPGLELETSPFTVQDRLGPWPGAAGRLRRAGVSAFGVGGTNAHVVLEQAPIRAEVDAAGVEGGSPTVLLLSARSADALSELRTSLASRLREPAEQIGEPSPPALADAAHTLRSGRRTFPHRLAVVARDRAEAVALLEGGAGQDGVGGRGRHPASQAVVAGLAPVEPRPVALLFPGQGTQHPRMGAGLDAAEPAYAAALDECADALRPALGFDLRDALRHGTADEDGLRGTGLAQPAIFAVSYATARLWASRGLAVPPAAMLGHSVGEFVAATLAGVFALHDALALVAARGRLMQAMPPGAMLSVRLSEVELRPLLEQGGLDLAAANAPELCVASGSEMAIAALEVALEARGAAHRRLRTSHAFHSAMMDPVVEAIGLEASRIPLSPPAAPVLSCVTGSWLTDAEATSPAYWAAHCRRPVRFAEALATLRAALPGAVLLEAGPGGTLTALALQSRVPPCAVGGATVATPLQAVASLPRPPMAGEDGATADRSAFARAEARLWTAGAGLAWHEAPPRGRRRVSLPTTPFERSRHWIEAPARVTPDDATGGAPPEAPTTSDTGATMPRDEPKATVLVPQAPPADISASREAEVRAAVAETLEALSGEPLSEGGLCGDATLLELGFDSLLLSQASAKLAVRYGVRVTFRQMMGDLGTVPALAAHIALALPPLPRPASEAQLALIPEAALGPAPEALTGSMPAASSAVPTTAAVLRDAGTASAVPPSPGLTALFEAQALAMSGLFAAQIEALRETRARAEGAPTPATGGALVERLAAQTVDAPASVEMVSRFGRFAPRTAARPKAAIAPGNAPLTREQRAFVDGLAARIAARSSASKGATAAHRRVLADPRAAAGFRPEWKELVFPLVCGRAEGARLWDADGHAYVDLVNGYGPSFFGHSPRFVVEAVEEQLRRGFAVGPQSDLAGEVAERLARMTGHERVTFCCTGSEAVMGALRLARAATGRDRVVAFSGAYHGGFDEVLVRGLRVRGEPRALPAAAGIPAAAVANVTVLEWADPASLDWVRAHAGELAAVLVEPVQSRDPATQPVEFLRGLREATEASGAALVFDEVVTGFRLHPGGAAALFGVRPDLATYGKVLGGGMPIGAIAGQARFMDALDGGGNWSYGDDSAPEADVTVFAGTFVRHPLALAAARAVLLHLEAAGPALQEAMDARAASFAARLDAALERFGARTRLARCGSILWLDLASEDRRASALLVHLLRERGVHAQENFPWFLTTAHGEAELDEAAAAFGDSLAALRSIGLIGGGPGDDPDGLSSGASRRDAARDRDAPRDAADGFVHAPVAAVTASAVAAGRAVPTTEPQREVLLGALLAPEASAAFNESVSVSLRGGPTDASALAAALGALVDRHDALRARFPDDDGATMSIRPAAGNGGVPLDLPLLDLGAVAAGADAALAALLDEEARAPFDLARGPLLRARLARRADNDHVLVLTGHHAVLDGWSFGVLLGELASLYRERTCGAAADLPPAPSFAEHARSTAGSDEAAGAAAALAFWRRRLAEMPPPAPALELPADRPRSDAARDFEGATERADVAPAAARDLRRAGAALGCTPFAMLLAAFVTLVGRLSGRVEALVGVPFAGQTLRPGAEGLVGHLVDFLPIGARWAANTVLADHAQAVQRTLLDAQEHGRPCTLGTILRGALPPGDASERPADRQPLTALYFNLDRASAPLDYGAGLIAEAGANPKTATLAELFLNVVETPDGGLRLELDYATALFDAATVRRWLAEYAVVLDELRSDARAVLVARPAPRLGARAPAAESAPRMPRGAWPLPPAREDTLAAVLAMWRDALGTDEIGPDSRFFDVGGHSMLGAQMVARARAAFRREVALAALFRAPTPRLFAALLDAAPPLGQAAMPPGLAAPSLPIRSFAPSPLVQASELASDQTDGPVAVPSLDADSGPDRPTVALAAAAGNGRTPSVRTAAPIGPTPSRPAPVLPAFAENVLPHPTLLAAARAAQGDDGLFPIETRGFAPTVIALNNPGLFHPLSRHLGPGRPFWAVRPLDPRHPTRDHPQNFAEVAALYAHAVRRAVPDGPVVLLGLCVAGSLAHEVAHLLRAEGRAVPLLVMVDSWVPGFMRRGGLQRRLLARAAYTVGAARVSLAQLRDGRLTLRRALASRPLALATGAAMERAAVLLGLREATSPEVEESAFARWLYEVSERHVPTPYAGRTLLLHREDMPRTGRWLDQRLGWGPFLSGPVAQHGLPGDHVGVFREPGAALMAEHIQAALAAEAKAGTMATSADAS